MRPTQQHPTENVPADRKPDLASFDPVTATWLTSSYSNGAGSMCVQIAHDTHGVILRDSQQPAGPFLPFSHGEWDAFIAGAGAGEFTRP